MTDYNISDIGWSDPIAGSTKVSNSQPLDTPPVGENNDPANSTLDTVGEFEQIVDKWTAHLPGLEWCQAGKAAILASHTKAVDQAQMLTATETDIFWLEWFWNMLILDGEHPKMMKEVRYKLDTSKHRLKALDKDSHR